MIECLFQCAKKSLRWDCHLDLTFLDAQHTAAVCPTSLAYTVILGKLVALRQIATIGKSLSSGEELKLVPAQVATAPQCSLGPVSEAALGRTGRAGLQDH